MFNLFNTRMPSSSPQETAEKTKAQNETVCLIDVRSRSEFKNGYARGAKNIPLETLKDHVDTLSVFEEVHVICQSGGRSAQAVNHLISQGVKAVNVVGGTSAWQSEGLPMSAEAR